jgi:ArsR family transcriptional regulator
MQKRKSPAMEEEILNRIAQIFKALSDTVRLKIIRCLCEGEMNVTQLIEALGMKQSNISQHLKILYQCGVVDRRKEGTQTFYVMSDSRVVQMCRQFSSSMVRDMAENAEKVKKIKDGKQLFG